jgi:RHS repeat-associated protein
VDLEATWAPGGKFGRVSYFHAGGIDRPLTITKNEITVVPHQNWRGQFARGTYQDGRISDCTSTTGTNCLAVNWPGWRTNPWHQDADTPDIVTWVGSLVDGMRDESGQMYMRNRYYDPATGQFTQPDPIGLAGGLNSYGFAAGDPVTYSDPYGLCAKDKNGREDANCRTIINYLRMVAREAQPSVPRGHVNRFSQAADVYERTTRRLEMVSPNDRRLRANDGSMAAGRTTDSAFLLSNTLGAGDLAAVATHEAVVHGHESGAYTGDLFSSETDAQIWYQLPDRLKPSAPFWRNKTGKTDEPLIDW